MKYDLPSSFCNNTEYFILPLLIQGQFEKLSFHRLQDAVDNLADVCDKIISSVLEENILQYHMLFLKHKL